MGLPRPLAEARFCPHCAAPLALRRPEGDSRDRLVCTACGQILYLGLKVAAGVIAERDGKALLIRRGVPPGIGLWSFPCGYAEIDETLEQCAVRETQEETGLEVRLGPLLGAWSDPAVPDRPAGVAVLAYAARILGGTAAAGDDATEIRFAGPEEIPWEELAFTSSRGALRAWIERRGAANAPGASSGAPMHQRRSTRRRGSTGTR